MPANVHCPELQALLRDVAAVRHADAMVPVARAGRDLCAGLAGPELGGAQLAEFMSAFNDRVVEQVLRITAAEQQLPQVPWCWLALGSEGRHEQTFTTDQDNGLIFSAADAREAEALRELFLPFAQAVNERLERCGFALCGGEVMARNPKWCLSLEEWRFCFSDWIRKPEPMALMHATIFFDFRCLCGDARLGERLRDDLLMLTSDTPSFLHLMAANALAAQPPLNFLGEVVAEDEAGGRLDLKKFGARIFVDAARIFALACGVRAVGTRERLARAGVAAGLKADAVAAAIDAFSQLLRLRLAAQAQALAAGGQPDHCVAPDRLHDLDRAILREALRQAKRLQQRLKLNYAL